MATNISTINKTGEDYASLTLWEDDTDYDLVTATTIEQADVYDDDGALSDAFTVAGATTNSSWYRVISSPVGERHNGTPNSGAKVIGEGTEAVIRCTESFFRLEWLIIEQTNASKYGIRGGSTAGRFMTLRNNIWITAGANAIQYDNTTNDRGNNVYNNICINGGIRLSGSFSSSLCYNNTVVDAAQGYQCNQGSSHPFTFINNLAQNCTNAFNMASGLDTTNSRNNLSDIVGDVPLGAQADSGTTTATSTGKLVQSGQNFLTTVKVGMTVVNTTDSTTTWITAVDSDTQLSLSSDIFTSGENFIIYHAYLGSIFFEDAANDDYHLSSLDTIAIDNGFDIGSGSLYVEDIDGRNRDSEGDTWDIGADEFTVTDLELIIDALGINSSELSPNVEGDKDIDDNSVNSSLNVNNIDINYLKDQFNIEVNLNSPDKDINKQINQQDLIINIVNNILNIENNINVLEINSNLFDLFKEIDLLPTVFNVLTDLKDSEVKIDLSVLLNTINSSLNNEEIQIDKNIEDLNININLNQLDTEVENSIGIIDLAVELQQFSIEYDKDINNIGLSVILIDPSFQTDNALNLLFAALNIESELKSPTLEIEKDISDLNIDIVLNTLETQVDNNAVALDIQSKVFTPSNIEIIKRLSKLLIDADLEEIIIEGTTVGLYDIFIRISRDTTKLINLNREEEKNIQINRTIYRNFKR